VSRGVARAAPLELDVAARPAIHDGPAVGGVFDLAAREMHDDRVGAVRVNAFLRAHLHPRANHRDAIILEDRVEAHAGERRIARTRSRRRRRLRRASAPRMLDEDAAPRLTASGWPRRLDG